MAKVGYICNIHIPTDWSMTGSVCGSMVVEFAKHIATNGLWEKYDKRLQQCVKRSDGNGYGFADAIADMYEEGCWLYKAKRQ